MRDRAEVGVTKECGATGLSNSHVKAARKPHTWRTRPDPFEGVWCEILDWLQHKPDATARELLDRLGHRYTVILSVSAGDTSAHYSAECDNGAA